MCEWCLISLYYCVIFVVMYVYFLSVFVFFFFFKQKTAYEMRISDWSSDVCSSDLPAVFSGEFSWPLKGSILTSFGPGVGGQRNEGIDIKAPKGTPIPAAADGVVAYAGDEIKLFGGLVLITHGSGWVTAYGHADSLNVVRGQ